VRSQLEVEDFFKSAIEALSCYGADVNSPSAMKSLGIGVSFGDNSRPSGTSSVDSVGAFASFGQEPLSVVYGSNANTTSGFGPTSTPNYGYPSDHADGQPGFGVVGYGDMGGVGFGSSMGSGGDPGFKDPAKFTYAGVSDSRGAFQRFMEARRDSTRFGKGTPKNTAYYGNVNTGSSNSASSSGASVGIGGSLSAFSFVSVSGSLDPTGNSRSDPNVIAARQAQNKFGFSMANPFGVNCTPRSDGEQVEDLSNPYT
jgi:hypothetical protein